MWIFLTAMSGPNLVHDVGYIEAGLTASLEMIAAMDEVIGMARRIVEGIEISDEALGLDVTDKVGPGGHFLLEDHTRRHFRENWFASLLDRGSYASWLEKRAKPLRQRANERVRQILETHAPEPLPAEVNDRLAMIMARAEKRAAEAKM